MSFVQPPSGSPAGQSTPLLFTCDATKSLNILADAAATISQGGAPLPPPPASSQVFSQVPPSSLALPTAPSTSTERQRFCRCGALTGRLRHLAGKNERFCREFRSEMAERRAKDHPLFWPSQLSLLVDAAVQRKVFASPLKFQNGADFSLYALLLQNISSSDETRAILFSNNDEGKKLYQKIRDLNSPDIRPLPPHFKLRMTLIRKSGRSLRYSLSNGQQEEQVFSLMGASQFSHEMFQELVRKTKYEEARDYVSYRSCPLNNKLEEWIYKIDCSYALRREKRFPEATEILDLALVEIGDQLEATGEGADKVTLKRWEYVAMAARVKCWFLCQRPLPDITAEIDKIETLAKEVLPQERLRPTATRVAELRIQEYQRKAQRASSDEEKKAHLIEAKRHAAHFQEAVFQQNKTHFQGLACELHANTLSGLGNQEASRQLFQQAAEIYEAQLGPGHRYTHRARSRFAYLGIARELPSDIPRPLGAAPLSKKRASTTATLSITEKRPREDKPFKERSIEEAQAWMQTYLPPALYELTKSWPLDGQALLNQTDEELLALLNQNRPAFFALKAILRGLR